MPQIGEREKLKKKKAGTCKKIIFFHLW